MRANKNPASLPPEMHFASRTSVMTLLIRRHAAPVESRTLPPSSPGPLRCKHPLSRISRAANAPLHPPHPENFPARADNTPRCSPPCRNTGGTAAHPSPGTVHRHLHPLPALPASAGDHARDVSSGNNRQLPPASAAATRSDTSRPSFRGHGSASVSSRNLRPRHAAARTPCHYLSIHAPGDCCRSGPPENRKGARGRPSCDRKTQRFSCASVPPGVAAPAPAAARCDRRAC